jgi:hypothetical protein
MQPLFEIEPAPLRSPLPSSLAEREDFDTMEIEEPPETLLKPSETKASAHFHVQVSDLLGYDIYPSGKGVTIQLVEE